jgi:hypothetical protein
MTSHGCLFTVFILQGNHFFPRLSCSKLWEAGGKGEIFTGRSWVIRAGNLGIYARFAVLGELCQIMNQGKLTVGVGEWGEIRCRTIKILHFAEDKFLL